MIVFPEPRVVASGLRFPEGPCYLGDGAVAVAEMQGEAVSRVAGDGTVTMLGDCGGGPNGTALGASDEVYVANNGGLSAAENGYWHAPREFDGCVQRVDDDTVRAVSDHLPGPAPHRPNDLCFGPDGTLYVTDSANWEDLRNIGQGRVVAVGQDGTVREIREMAAMPNGIAFDRSGARLLVAQSLTRKILVLDGIGDGAGEPRTFCTLPAGMPDGFCLDAEENVYVCGSVANALFVYDRDGGLLGQVDTGEGTQPTNCCFGDGVLYVTYSAVGRLVAFDLDRAGLPLRTGSVSARNTERLASP